MFSAIALIVFRVELWRYHEELGTASLIKSKTEHSIQISGSGEMLLILRANFFLNQYNYDVHLVSLSFKPWPHILYRRAHSANKNNGIILWFWQIKLLNYKLCVVCTWYKKKKCRIIGCAGSNVILLTAK